MEIDLEELLGGGGHHGGGGGPFRSHTFTNGSKQPQQDATIEKEIFVTLEDVAKGVEVRHVPECKQQSVGKLMNL